MLNNLGGSPMVLPGSRPPLLPIEDKDEKSTATPGTVQMLTRASKRRDRHVLSRNDMPPNCWSPVSETLGRAISSLLRRNPNRLHEVCEKLAGKQLPGGLRQYIWTEVLFKSDKSLLSKEGNIEKLLRNRFAKKVSMGKIDLKLKKATYTPIHGLIWNAIVEMFDSTPSMQAYQKREHMKENANVLNVLYTYNRSYEPYLIQWLFPVQLTFMDRKAEEEKPYELAMYLDLLMTNLFPKWPEVFATAEKTMSRLKIQDPDLQDHLEECALKNVDLDPKQFLVQLIHIEKDKALALGRASPGSETSLKLSKELLADPVIFVRKWMGEGFVGILDGQAVLYVWDQLFMNGWKHDILEDFCFALLLLLKDAFHQANDYHQMKQVFLQQPARLYTADIQRAYLHLRQGGSPSDIPGFNRYRPQGTLFTPGRSREGSKQASPLPPTSKSKHPSRDEARGQLSPGALTDIDPGELKPVGLKHLKMTLVLRHENVQETNDRLSTADKWKRDQMVALSKFDADNVKIAVSVFYGLVKLRTIQTQTKAKTYTPNQDDVKAPKNNTRVFYLEIPDEELLFYNLDPSGFHGARGKHSHPFALIKILYQIPSGSKGSLQTISLGWVKLPLYELKPGAESGRQSKVSLKSSVSQNIKSPWSILADDYKEAILPGPAPENITAIDQQKTYTGQDFLQEGHSLEFECLIFRLSHQHYVNLHQLKSQPGHHHQCHKPITTPTRTVPTTESSQPLTK
ncbi:uncharacterized protein [Ptychodera flava]|uniref:uncharacterized protein n=1 Tax=Ptychodera flava TaxID=63121 RepID=UPI00396AA764